MRASMPGDDAYLLAHKGQRGAKGDARGRSVELVHQVLATWLCERPDVAARVPAPTGDRYTRASAKAVREFQDAMGEAKDGIVGPGTLDIMDYYIHGAPVPQPPSCDGPPPEPVGTVTCGEREPDEVERSRHRGVQFESRTRATRMEHEQWSAVTDFPVDDASLDTASPATIAELERLMDPSVFKKVDGTALDCWKLEGITLYGFADCHEDPRLARQRAEALRARFPHAPIRVESASGATTASQQGARDRADNRSVLVKAGFERIDRIDLAGSLLDELLREVWPNRERLGARWTRPIIKLGMLLARDPDPDCLDHRILTVAGAEQLANRRFPDGCSDTFEYPWQSARKLVALRMVQKASEYDFCGEDGLLPALDDLMDCIRAAVWEPMRYGIRETVLQAALWTQSRSMGGCPCFGFVELRQRSRENGDIYSAIPQNDVIWAGSDPSREFCYGR